MGTEGFKRKITAIMSADVVGYNSLNEYNLLHTALNC